MIVREDCSLANQRRVVNCAKDLKIHSRGNSCFTLAKANPNHQSRGNLDSQISRYLIEVAEKLKITEYSNTAQGSQSLKDDSTMTSKGESVGAYFVRLPLCE